MAERKEMDKLVDEYEADRRADKEQAEARRNQLFEMMQQNIE